MPRAQVVDNAPAARNLQRLVVNKIRSVPPGPQKRRLKSRHASETTLKGTVNQRRQPVGDVYDTMAHYNSARPRAPNQLAPGARIAAQDPNHPHARVNHAHTEALRLRTLDSVDLALNDSNQNHQRLFAPQEIEKLKTAYAGSDRQLMQMAPEIFQIVGVTPPIGDEFKPEQMRRLVKQFIDDNDQTGVNIDGYDDTRSTLHHV